MAKLTITALKISGLVLATGLSLGGCATQSYVDKHVAVVQGQVTDVQGHQQASDQHLSQVDQTAQDALQRAEAANKLAEGKFLYSMVLSDDSVKFPTDGRQLSPEAQTRLADFVQKLKSDNKNVYLEIQGHTDSTGPKPLNERLGEERAEAVRLFMNQQGVPLNRMATISYGPDAPVAPNTTREGRAQNRRVVLIVMA
jgi:peptidoglycan-associated lipoprotein